RLRPEPSPPGRRRRRERAAGPGPRLWCSPAAGEAEHALGDDVALDLGRSRVDRLGLRPHPAVLPAPILHGELRVGRERAVHPLDADRRLLQPLVHLAPVKLGHARLGPRSVAVLGPSQVAKPDHTEYVRLDAGLGDPLPRRRVGARASVARQRREIADRPLEACSLRKASALEAEDRHRDLPAIARLPDEVSLVDPGAGEEDLAELAAAGHLLDTPDL